MKKSVQKKLNTAWKKRLKFRIKGDKLYAEGNKLYAKSVKLYAEGDRLYAEGNKLRAEGNKLCAEGDKLWAEAVLAEFGNIPMNYVWDSEKSEHSCILSTLDGELRFDP